jgi:hypothetical protein
VRAVLDGANTYTYDVAIRHGVSYRSNHTVLVSGVTEPFPFQLISDTRNNRTFLVQPSNGTCYTFFFDGIPFDGSPFDGLLWLVAAAKADEHLFAFAKTVNLHGVSADRFDLTRTVSPSSISHYWHASLYMTAGTKNSNLLRVEVEGLGKHGANHSLSEDYLLHPVEPASGLFAKPMQCTAPCINCAHY